VAWNYIFQQEMNLIQCDCDHSQPRCQMAYLFSLQICLIICYVMLGTFIKASSFFKSIARWTWWSVTHTSTASSKTAVT